MNNKVIESSTSALLKRSQENTDKSSVKKSKKDDKEKVKRVTLTALQKKELCQKKTTNLRITNVELAKEYGIGEGTVSGILKEKDKWLMIELDTPEANMKRMRSPAWPQIEDALSMWIDQAIRQEHIISGHIIKNKAKNFAKLLQIDNFTASEGWLEGFKKRHNIKEYAKRGEANSAPLEDLPKFRLELQEIIKQYQLSDVFNCDETALFWLLEPSKTLAKGAMSGTKKSKERITIMLTCSALGEKIKPVLIHKYENPRSLKNITKTNLPVFYYWNKKAWMQNLIWNAYLKQLNQIMKIQNRHILLLADNAPCHIVNESSNLSNITVHFLPPNTTAHLQPCDAGIIYSFKVSFLYFY
jgi:hypothetical protein